MSATLTNGVPTTPATGYPLSSLTGTIARLTAGLDRMAIKFRKLERQVELVNASIDRARGTALEVTGAVDAIQMTLASTMGPDRPTVPDAPNAQPVTPPAREEVLAALNGTPAVTVPAPAPIPSPTPTAAAPITPEAAQPPPVAEVAPVPAPDAPAAIPVANPAPPAILPTLTTWKAVNALDGPTTAALMAYLGLEATGNGGKDRGAVWAALKGRGADGAN